MFLSDPKSAGSCDTEDWNKDCWKFRFVITRINYILNIFQIERYITKLRFYCIFDQINAAWWTWKQLTDPNIFEGVWSVYLYIYIYTGLLHIRIIRSSYSAFPPHLEAIPWHGAGGGGGFLIPWFLKDHVTLKIGVMVAENSAWSLQE